MIPKGNLSRLLNLITSSFVGLAGVFLVLDLATRRFHLHLHQEILFYNFNRISHLLVLVIALLLIYLALQLSRRRRNAYLLSVALFVVLIIFELLFGEHHWRLLVYLPVLALLEINRHNYNVKSDNLSLRTGTINALIIMLAAFVYAVLGFYFLERRDFNINFSLGQSIMAALVQLFTFQNQVFIPRTHYAAWFLDSVDLAGVTAVIIAVSSLFKPLLFRYLTPEKDILKAKKILQKYSDSTEDFFKLWPKDKHYFFANASKAFLAYKVENGVALVLDGPSGNRNYFQELFKNFLSFCDENGWLVSVIHADKKNSDLLSPLGFNSFNIGHEALVDVAKFIENERNNKHFRYVLNKARRENLKYLLWTPPLTDIQLKNLSRISELWQTGNNKKEYTFVMAPFSDEYMRNCQVAVAMQNNKPVAYANLIQSFLKDARTIDHMRSIPGASAVAMHYLILNIIEMLNGQSVKIFNLGLSPLAKVEGQGNSALKKIIARIKNIVNLVYSASGLERFKNYYRPDWQPRYICYQGGLPNLVKTAFALNKAITVTQQQPQYRWYIFGISLSALMYSSFLYARLLNVNLVGGVISNLGAQGQPYARFFNLLDIFSGSILIIVSITLILKLKSKFNFLAISLYVFSLSGIGTVLAAIFALPVGKYHGFFNSHLVWHNLSSALSSGGLITSALIIGAYPLLKKEPFRLTNLYAIIFVLLGGLTTISYFIASYELQPVFILACSAWMIIFFFFVSRKVLK